MLLINLVQERLSAFVAPEFFLFQLVESNPIYGLVLLAFPALATLHVAGLDAVAAVQGLAFYFILVTLDIDIPLYTAMSIYAISLLAGALSFVPGGIGTTEAVMGLLLLGSGTDTVSAVAVPLISRLSTLWFAVILGLLSSLYLGSGKTETTSTTSDQ